MGEKYTTRKQSTSELEKSKLLKLGVHTFAFKLSSDKKHRYVYASTTKTWTCRRMLIGHFKNKERQMLQDIDDVLNDINELITVFDDYVNT